MNFDDLIRFASYSQIASRNAKGSISIIGSTNLKPVRIRVSGIAQAMPAARSSESAPATISATGRH